MAIRCAENLPDVQGMKGNRSEEPRPNFKKVLEKGAREGTQKGKTGQKLSDSGRKTIRHRALIY